jgi:hypothetical protein
MKFRLYILLLFILILTFKLNAQELKIFELMYYEKDSTQSLAFISLSDVYDLSVHPDSLAIPDLSEIGIEDSKKFEYIKLDEKYRKRFLSKTKISETDIVFIYDYSHDVLMSFTVKNLNIVACLNVYGADWPYSQEDYMIGFEINKKYLTGFGKYPSNTLVYVGKENPFVQGQVKHVVWKKIESKNFPVSAISSEDTTELNKYLIKGRYVTGNAYKYEKDGLQYFIQDILRLTDDWIFAKRLIVIDLKTKETVFKKNYFDSEGESFAPLDNQWTGKLFKNKPSVIFGFMWISFGCPGITFLDSAKKEDIYINCDNRH